MFIFGLFLVEDNAPVRNLMKSIFQEYSNLCSIFHLSHNVDLCACLNHPRCKQITRPPWKYFWMSSAHTKGFPQPTLHNKSIFGWGSKFNVVVQWMITQSFSEFLKLSSELSRPQRTETLMLSERRSVCNNNKTGLSTRNHP